jgi:hypothetical protein
VGLSGKVTFVSDVQDSWGSKPVKSTSR